MSGARFVDKSCPLDWNRACLRLDFIGRDAGFESMIGFSKLGSYSFTKNSALTLTLSPRRGEAGGVPFGDIEGIGFGGGVLADGE